jgi:ABC-type transport system involved in cytochrome c biogenesis permease subunit
VIDAGLARLSDSLLLWAAVCYAVAGLGYASELVASRRRVRPIAGGAVDTVPPLSSAARDLVTPPVSWVGRSAVVVTVAGWLLHLAAVVTRGVAADRVPWGNMYEFSSVVCLAAVGSYLWLLRTQPVLRYGGFVLGPVVALLAVAGTALYAPAAPLVPALDSYWITIHVVAAVAASGMFLVGFVLNGVYLAGRSERLEELAARVNGSAFLVWTFAVVAGAVWAEAAWGRYWGWDPKETWSFVTWAFYAAYLHARTTRGWRGRPAAWVGVVGFAALMFCYYGVNLWISGLHSYSGV